MSIKSRVKKNVRRLIGRKLSKRFGLAHKKHRRSRSR
jgi:hypothetical protein